MSAEYNFIYNAVDNIIILRGSTVTRLYTYFDNLNIPQTPDSVTMKLIAPNSNVITITPTLRTLGKYLLSYKVPNNAQVGTWRIIVTVIKGVNSQTSTQIFIVE